VLKEIKIDDISQNDVVLYVNHQILTRDPSPEILTRCLKTTSLGKEESQIVQEFALSAKSVVDNFQLGVDIKTYQSKFFLQCIYNPSTHHQSANDIKIMYRGFKKLNPIDISREIDMCVDTVVQKITGLVDPTLFTQLYDFALHNEIITGIIFMPSVLLCIGFTPFWSYVFPYFFESSGNAQSFIGEVKAKLFSNQTNFPKYLPNITFVVKYK